MTGTAPVIPAFAAQLDRWFEWGRRVNLVAWPLLAAGLIIALLASTWQQWTVIAFPFDAGRELVVPQMLNDGKVLYRDVRCFYGPVGYWLNAYGMDLLGGDLHALWWTNTLRFAATCGLLWVLARYMLSSSAWATLVLAASVLPLFQSFLVPYSASVGWGAFFLLAGLVCAAPQLSNGRVACRGLLIRVWAYRSSEWVSGESRALIHSTTAAACLALAAACKHEYALAAGLVWVGLMVDALWRGQSLLAKVTREGAGSQQLNVRHVNAVELHGSVLMSGLVMGMTVPLAVIGKTVLSKVSWHSLLYENLWLGDLMAYHRQSVGYRLSAVFATSESIVLAELLALLGAAVSAVGLFGVCRRTKPWDVASRRELALWAAAAYLCILVAGAAEIAARTYSMRSGEVFGIAKLRQLIECTPMLIVPGTFILVVASLASAWRRGLRTVWQQTAMVDRLGFLCVLACVPFCARGLPGLTTLNRQPMPVLVLGWLLLRVIPSWRCWTAEQRRMGSAGGALLLIAGTVIGLNRIAHEQSRPHAQMYGPAGSAYVMQRRQPYTPAYFQSALQMMRENEDRVAGHSLACVPEGAWVNALLGLSWPMRDTQWMPFCQPWVLEDLACMPPSYLLQLEPLHDQMPVERAIAATYVPIARNALGMTLYEYKGSSRLAGSVSSTGGSTDETRIDHR